MEVLLQDCLLGVRGSVKSEGKPRKQDDHKDSSHLSLLVLPQGNKGDIQEHLNTVAVNVLIVLSLHHFDGLLFCCQTHPTEEAQLVSIYKSEAILLFNGLEESFSL